MDNNYCYGCMKHTDRPNHTCGECGFDFNTYEIDPHQLQPGTLLHDRYMVGRVIGEGGFGITYVGRDTLLDMKVAVKEFYMNGFVNRNNTVSMLVQASVGTNAELFEKNKGKFIDEARVLAKFANEEGIVGIRDFFEENNTAYMIMDFLEGETLKAHLGESGKIPAEEVIRIMRPVMRSLQNVHNNNVIHRDISPDNIMMLENNRVKLLDFGAAREISKTDMRSLSVILKPGYAPEEQYRSKGKQGPWTDVYALCATMYRCIAGITPDDAMERMFDDKLVSLDTLGVCQPALSSVIMKGLAVRQENRYQSVAELQRDIERALTDPSFRAQGAVPAVSRKPAQDSDATVYAGADYVPTQGPGVTGPVPPPQVTAPRTDSQQTAPQTAPRTAPQTAPQTVPQMPVSPQRENKDVTTTPLAGGTQQKTVKKGDTTKPVGKKKKKWWLIPVIAAPVLIALIIAIIATGSAHRSKAREAAVFFLLQDYSFSLNGVQYALPMKYDELYKSGWEFDDDSMAEKELAPGGYEYDVKLINGYGYIRVSFYNPTTATLPLKDAEIDQIYVDRYSLNSNYLNEDINTFSVVTNSGAEVATINETTSKEFNQTFKSNGRSIKFTEDDQHRYQFDFNNDVLSSVTIKNRQEDFIKAEVQSAPDYDPNALLHNDVNCWTVANDATDALVYFAPAVSLNDYLSLGWTIEKAPETIASGAKDEVYLRFNKTTTAILEVYNPFRSETYTEDCIVTYVTTTKVEADGNFLLVELETGDVNIWDPARPKAVPAFLAAGYVLNEEQSTATKAVYEHEDGFVLTVYYDAAYQITDVSMDARSWVKNYDFGE